jgi:hypothetical protein
MAYIDWLIRTKQIGTCSCDYGCPCEFNALPTRLPCEGVMAMEITEGYFGSVRPVRASEAPPDGKSRPTRKNEPARRLARDPNAAMLPSRSFHTAKTQSRTCIVLPSCGAAF